MRKGGDFHEDGSDVDSGAGADQGPAGCACVNRAQRPAGLFGTCWRNIQTGSSDEPERTVSDGTSREKGSGLAGRKDSTGKTVWYVRLYHEGKERRFGSFSTKTEARDFYEKAKQEQKHGRFFPERYQHGGSILVEELLTRHAETTTVKNQAAEKHYMAWWNERLKGVRLNHVKAAVIEDAQRDPARTEPAPHKRCSIT